MGSKHSKAKHDNCKKNDTSDSYGEVDTNRKDVFDDYKHSNSESIGFIANKFHPGALQLDYDTSPVKSPVDTKSDFKNKVADNDPDQQESGAKNTYTKRDTLMELDPLSKDHGSKKNSIVEKGFRSKKFFTLKISDIFTKYATVNDRDNREGDANKKIFKRNVHSNHSKTMKLRPKHINLFLKSSIFSRKSSFIGNSTNSGVSNKLYLIEDNLRDVKSIGNRFEEKTDGNSKQNHLSVQKSKKIVKIDRTKFVLEHPSQLGLNQFYIIESQILGQGTYGNVLKGIKKDTNQIRAIKSIRKIQIKNSRRLRQEISIMKNLDHPNVIKLYETFEDARNVYLVLEFCKGGELFDSIISKGRFSENDAAVIMKQIFSSLHYLHSHSIMHRDLKPENFLFSDESCSSPLKIIDFGLSCRFQIGQYAVTKAGTPYYVSPQVLKGKYDFSCDNWSSGVIMYILLCGYPPFNGENDSEVLRRVKSGIFTFSGSEWESVSGEAKDLIRKLLRINPKERFTAEQALQHSWIKNLAKHNQNLVLPETFVTNLKNFRLRNSLMKAALTVIALHIHEKEIENLRQIFVHLDVDNSGTLSLQEVYNGLKQLGYTEIPSDFQEIIDEVDSDGSGYIDYTEFIAATMDRQLYSKEDICWAAFCVFDLNGDGKISREELIKFLGTPNAEDAFGKEAIDSLLRDIDLNGDGEIDFKEFLQMF